jgi:cytoskeleton protein RodZ
MKKENHREYFETLEVSPDASLLEIRKAYTLLKELYSVESIVTLPLKDDISEGDRRDILAQIEDAYQNLLVLYESRNGSLGQGRVRERSADNPKETVSDVPTFTGAALRDIRRELNIDLQDVAFATRIPLHHLENIENENYDALPPEVYTRGFVVSYAKYLSVDPKRVADDYIDRYRAGRE